MAVGLTIIKDPSRVHILSWYDHAPRYNKFIWEACLSVMYHTVGYFNFKTFHLHDFKILMKLLSNARLCPKLCANEDNSYYSFPSF